MLSQGFTSQWTETLFDLVLSRVLYAIADVNVLGIQPFAGLRTWADDLSNQAITAYNTAATAQAGLDTTVAGITGTTDPTQVAPVVSSLQDTSTSNASAIAEINADQNASSTGGNKFGDNFNTDANPLSGWTQVAGGAAQIMADNGQAVLSDGGTATGARFARYNATTAGDDQSVIGVIGTTHSALFQATTIICRGNSTLSSFIYANVFINKVYVGNATHSGSSMPTWNDWNSGGTSISISAGSTVELKVQGNTYSFLVNGVVKYSHTDTTYVSTFTDGTHRYAGFGLSAGGAGVSCNLNSLNVSDLAQVAVVGTGWRLYRSSTGATGTTSWGTSGTALDSSTFDVQDTAATANVTVDNLGLGRVRIIKPGFYSASVNLRTNGLTLGGAPALFGGTSTGSLSLIRVGQPNEYQTDSASNTPGGLHNFSASWSGIYCPAGYYLQPVGFKESGSSSIAITGNAAGYSTVFSGQLGAQ